MLYPHYAPEFDRGMVRALGIWVSLLHWRRNCLAPPSPVPWLSLLVMGTHALGYTSSIPCGKVTYVWKITFFNGKSFYKWHCSIAILNYQSVDPNLSWNLLCLVAGDQRATIWEDHRCMHSSHHEARLFGEKEMVGATRTWILSRQGSQSESISSGFGFAALLALFWGTTMRECLCIPGRTKCVCICYSVISPFIPLISNCSTRLTKCCNQRRSSNVYV